MKNHALSEGMKALIEVRKKNSRATEFFVAKVTDVTESGWIHAELAGGDTRRFKVDAGPEDEPYIRRQLSSRAKLRGPISEEAAMKIWEAEKGKLKAEPKARTTRKKAAAKSDTSPAKTTRKKAATKKAPARRRAKEEEEDSAPKTTRKKAGATKKVATKKVATKKAPARRLAKAEEEEKPATRRKRGGSPAPVATRRRRSAAA